MPEKTSLDPAAALREFAQVFEKGFNEAANASMSTDEFSNASNRAMTAALRAQQTIGTAMGTYLATLNIPSRADISAIGERLAACEAYLARIALALEKGDVSEAPPAKRPPRTRRPPGKPAR